MTSEDAATIGSCNELPTRLLFGDFDFGDVGNAEVGSKGSGVRRGVVFLRDGEGGADDGEGSLHVLAPGEA